MAGDDDDKENDSDDEDNLEETQIEWSNLIFLPFHPTFQIFVMFSVIIKSILGPIQSIFPVVYCWDTMDNNNILLFIKYFYWYCGDTIYGIDTFLHIVHRQVTDKAMRREHLPKSAFLLLLDFAALIPFFRLMTTNDCPPVTLWPNMLAFTEFLVMYRVVDYYSLITTHSLWNLIVGFVLILLCVLNCITCFWILLTKTGLCVNCKNTVIYDWRNNFLSKLNETELAYTTYVYGQVFVISYTLNKHLDNTRPFTIEEYLVVCVLAVLGYLLAICFLLPKIFAESILRLRKIFTGQPHVERLIEETQRRNPGSKSHVKVENFYSVVWKKRSGITKVPEIILKLPRCLRIDMKLDLHWALFYHSPILRKTGEPFKRWMSQQIILEFKLPGESFFAGPQACTNLYYLKSGVVQILSTDDNVTPILSVTSGTIFGDTSFLVPPFKRKVTVKCLTYCEVTYVSRQIYIKGLHKYPEDRQLILKMANDRLKHAKTLYSCKENVRGLDRVEDEGIYWVKRRWWEISDSLARWKTRSTKNHSRFELPPEETIYHCSKYIGQLVLCTDAQLQTKSLFASVKFPWLFIPHSAFTAVWYKIVVATVFCVLIIYPPNITRRKIPTWFKFFQVWTDMVYTTDICISLLTEITQQDSAPTNFSSAMFARCKTFYFNLDMLATVWIEYIAIIIGKPQFFNIAQFNRLIKIYLLFTGEYINWGIRKNPMIRVCYIVVMVNFCFVYISSYIIYAICKNYGGVTWGYHFGEKYCFPTKTGECDPGAVHVLSVAVSFFVEVMFFSVITPRTLMDLYISLIWSLSGYFICMCCRTLFISAVYLSFRDVSNFRNFVLNLKKYYEYYKIHHNLLKRLDVYLMCHWKYYHGAEVMNPNVLSNEPYDIYWKVQGEVAENIIGGSQAFLGAESTLIRDLAYASKFLILPTKSTLFLFGVQCKNVTWIVQGHVKCEYHNDEGELVEVVYRPGQLLSISSVFLGKVSLRTYTACTDCEILYLSVNNFYKILKRYPNEWSHLNRCISEFAPIFEEIFVSYMKKHKEYQSKLRARIFHVRKSTMTHKEAITENLESRPLLPIQQDYWTDPESEFLQYWCLFRMIMVVVSIINAAVQGGSGAMYRRQLVMIGAFCNCVSWIDIVLKLFLAYYDSRGILIYDKRYCIMHYLCRGFCMDIIGAMPWYEVVRNLTSHSLNEDHILMINTLCKFAHLYIVVGYFNYISDLPTVNGTYINIIKCQLVMLLIMFGASHFLMTYCIDFEFDHVDNLLKTELRNTCWMPQLFDLNQHLSAKELHLIFSKSLQLTQGGFLGMNFRKFKVNRDNVGVASALVVLQLVFWYAMAYSLTLLVLNSRGDTLFQHGVRQLNKYLVAERIDTKLINQAIAHFSYWWMRTRGTNVQHLTNERIGMVFRQDLSYYFYKSTFLSLDMLLEGGDNLGRQLASVSTEVYVLPDEEIIREMDLTSSVYVVHRGKVALYLNGEKVVSLGKGSLFGQLDGPKPRPVRISAMAEGYADLLQINIKQFQEIINDDVREKIAKNSKVDYMATKKRYTEDPYDTIQYIIRRRKTIKLPWMYTPLEARHNNWYSRWLYIAWLVEPFLSACTVLVLKTLKYYIIVKLYWFLALLDLFHFINFVFELFTVELVVIEKRLVYRIVGYRKLKQLGFYSDALTLVVPLLTIFTKNINYQLIRLLRLRLLFDFHKNFCRSFKSEVGPVLLKIASLFLLLHSMACGWLIIACRNNTFSYAISSVPDNINKTIDYSQWSLAQDRREGCTRILDSGPGTLKQVFVVPSHWHDDYILAFSYILLLHTHSPVQSVLLLDINQVLYNTFITFIIMNVNIWVISVTVSFVYTKYRELYLFDYNVNNLLTYLSRSGLAPGLLEAVNKYTSQLWKRQKGNWMPELAQQAPMCLREDLHSALYMHHLDTPPLFRDLPYFFKRQVVARLRRKVLFPGKCIVKEGDIFPCIYFIHEGEVEKWYVDKSGEQRVMSLLTANGYFGQIPGVFPNYAFQFSYYTRTVVDLACLKLENWQDLMNAYPTIKQDIYQSATQLKREFGK